MPQLKSPPLNSLDKGRDSRVTSYVSKLLFAHYDPASWLLGKSTSLGASPLSYRKLMLNL